ncbi:hypothetical protein BDV38DRAFT_264009 [Aspergillus pseudotamarii]|uniref:Uncharacterized protein n=1 Tax=Aspergillus pseudotamarii TaxID=132259 RepID=A0A5N6SCZ4_ASPPS|nr:uncharacterized protein BDV38DRAFT_264009 [Aspergillus pseudotamarii]KAE8131560.1 hypothetical protein BDV38DRAFT_264009 [Aspergillus pseudotamarii]
MLDSHNGIVPNVLYCMKFRGSLDKFIVRTPLIGCAALSVSFLPSLVVCVVCPKSCLLPPHGLIVGGSTRREHGPALIPTD